MVSLAGLLPLPCAVAQQGPYPKPLPHTPTDHPAKRVVFLSVDGLGAADLAHWVDTHPQSALAELSARGVTYTNAHTPIADPAAGLIALVTGGTPISTGIVGVDGFDRSLSPPGSQCTTRGAALGLGAAISPSALPLDPGHECEPVEPHQLLRVNNIFEVVHSQLGRTAWAGDGPALTDLLRGESGRGLDDACSVARKPRPGPAAGVERRNEDQGRIAMLLGWLAGRDCNGKAATVPVLSGISLTEASTSPDGLTALDSDVSRIVTELRNQHLDDSTWIVVTSPFANSSALAAPRVIPISRLRDALDHADSGSARGSVRVLHISSGRVAMVWLADSSETDAAAASLSRRAESLGIEQIVTGTTLTLTWNNPEADPRVPNLILEAIPGVTWTAPTSRGSASSMGEDETHVALLVAGAQLDGRQDKTPVPTTQLAPLLLRALGLEKFDLEALQKEHTPALPGIF